MASLAYFAAPASLLAQGVSLAAPPSQPPADVPAAAGKDPVVTFDPADPGVIAAGRMMRQRSMYDVPERTLPDWCYPTPPPDPDAPGPWAMPCPPAGLSLDDRVDQPVRWYGKLSFVTLWDDGYDIPALVTTSPAGTAQTDAGVRPDATVLFGNEAIDDGPRTGGHVKLGWWLIDGQFMAIEGDYWALGQEGTHFSTSSSFQNDPAGAFILARPFFNAPLLEEDAAILAFPNFVRPGATVDLDGRVDVETDSEMQSAGMTFRHIVWANFERQFRLDVFGGYRFLQLDESIVVRDAFFDPGGGLLAPTLRESTDIYDARNDFHGGEIGLSMEVFRSRWSLEFMAKAILGNNHQEVTIDGATRIESLGTEAFAPGGLLAQPADLGSRTRDVFMAIPEGSATLRYALLDNLELGVGFRILYLDDVVRPGEQIDTTINGLPSTSAPLVTTDMLLRGVDLSLEYRW